MNLSMDLPRAIKPDKEFCPKCLIPVENKNFHNYTVKLPDIIINFQCEKCSGYVQIRAKILGKGLLTIAGGSLAKT